MSGDNITVPPWQESIYQVLKKGGIRQVSYVPDAGHAHVIRRVLGDAAHFIIAEHPADHVPHARDDARRACGVQSLAGSDEQGHPGVHGTHGDSGRACGYRR